MRQVLWVEGEAVHHREYYKEEEAAKFYNEIPIEKCKRMTHKGGEVCRNTPGPFPGACQNCKLR